MQFGLIEEYILRAIPGIVSDIVVNLRSSIIN